jgi:hypothetical protein
MKTARIDLGNECMVRIERPLTHILLYVASQVDQLRRAGGGDVKELTDNILSKLLTNNAASFYNLDGRKGMNCLVYKKAFCKLSIYRVVEGIEVLKFV